MAGYSATPLAKKLGIKEGHRVFLSAAPRNYRKLLKPLPSGVVFVSRITDATDLIQAFFLRRSEIARFLKSALSVMKKDCPLWVSWPKKSSGAETDITEDVIRDVALPLDLVDIKVCAVDGIWSGLKLVVRKEKR